MAALRQEVVHGQAAVAGPAGLLETTRGYLSLTKPRIISLLLITTVPAMMLAEGGMPSLWLVALTLLGGSLSAGGANAINCFLDRDIDGVMARTQGRPLPLGSIRPERALLFGGALGALGFGVLASGVNVESAMLATFALAFYVFVYTIWLKRVTAQNIVIGGAAGAMPPLVGWAAVTGSLDWPAAILFAIIFFWTPPHFWALALRYQGDYARARVPMLPVVRGERETRRQIVLYSVVLVAVSALLVPFGGAGMLYLASALALGAVFLALALRLWADPTARRSMTLFFYSLVYLALLFGAVGFDVAV